ncbi:hypothetical protein F4604DRAFT_1592122, partial [Suillus subluteus]
MEAVAVRPSTVQRQKRECQCIHCKLDRSDLGCQKPYKCQKLMKDILKCVKPKWDPNLKITEHILELSQDQITTNEKAMKLGGIVIFQTTIPAPRSISEGFRIF